jgi:hypothetical protein
MGTKMKTLIWDEMAWEFNRNLIEERGIAPLFKTRQCPYCGDVKGLDASGCCGESAAHFEEVWLNEDTGENATDEEIGKWLDIQKNLKIEYITTEE